MESQDDLIEQLATEAEAGYDPDRLVNGATDSSDRFHNLAPLPDRRGREVQMAYVDGYLLGCQDVLRQIKQHRDWAMVDQQIIETQSFWGGATKMHKRVRMSVEAILMGAKEALHRLRVADRGEQIVAGDAEILVRLKESDGPA